MKLLVGKLKKEAKKHNLRMVVLFGSQAVGKANEQSDYDVAILLEGNEKIDDLQEYNSLLSFLAEILQTSEEKIDLTDVRTAPPLLFHEIFSEGTLLYGDEMDHEEYRAKAFRKYIDAQPLFDLRRTIIEKKQKLLKEKIYA